jgi:dCTP deaminase
VILTDREIKIAIESGNIGIEPKPNQDAYASTSVDLTLDKNVRLYKLAREGIETVLDPTAKNYNFVRVLEQLSDKDEINDGGYVLNPSRLILAWTRENVNLQTQSRIAARVEGKSSMARIGLLVHLTAPTIHSGFKGQIQLEIINLGPLPIKLKTGMRICQLVFEQTLGVPEIGYQGQFSSQTSQM